MKWFSQKNKTQSQDVQEQSMDCDEGRRGGGLFNGFSRHSCCPGQGCCCPDPLLL